MTDPEIEYQRLISGDAAALRAASETLESAMAQLESARTEIADCTNIMWTGTAADAFSGRVLGLRQGVAMNRSAVNRARGALETSAAAYDDAVDNANYYIGFWRNRPALPPVVEEIFARLVNACLMSVGVGYNGQLAGVSAVLNGEDVDLDELDEDTREWVEKGLAKNEDWLDGNDSSLGPLIPNTAATGDGRGLVPQGLGYVPGTGSHAGTLVQAYDGGKGKPSVIALIDEATGRELGEVELGGARNILGDEDPESNGPSHAGGVAVDGDNVYVTDDGKVYTYSLRDLRDATPGEPALQSAPVQALPGGSYSTVQDGKLYLGDFKNDTMYVYERNSAGGWGPDAVDTVNTPNECQGVVVRDGQYVFSSSYGRQNGSSLIVQDRDDETDRSTYDLPNMSQGVVEVNGDLVVNYESGAREFDHMPYGWVPGRPDDSDLWPNPFMTRTPLSDLGLGDDLDVQPDTLTKAANDLDSPASTLMSVSSMLASVVVQPHLFGEVPKAATVSKGVNKLVEFSADSVRTGAKAVALTSDNLAAVAKDYVGTDEFIGSVFTPR